MAIRQDPWHELARLGNDFDDAFARSFGRPVGGWLPAADVTRDEGEIVITMDLPGMTADDVEVELHDHSLTISGERSNQSRGDKASRERRFGRFTRSFALPLSGLEDDDVTAELENGELTVRVALPAERDTRRIPVTSAPTTAA